MIFGAGTAGTGIADQLSAGMQAGGLSEVAARVRFWTVDRAGLLTDATPGLGDAQAETSARSARVWLRTRAGRRAAPVRAVRGRGGGMAA